MSKPLVIEHAFITAAGFGSRMRPLTDDRCKPMVEVGGKPIIGHVLDRLVAAGVKHVGVNSFYKPDSLEAYLQQYEAAHPGLTISIVREHELMDTGGGIKGGLSTMPNAPFYVVSGDSYWEDDASTGDALKLMAAQFDPAKMDMLMMLKTLADMHPTRGSADYNIDNAGKISRTPDKTGPYAWMSVRIIKDHSLFDNTPDTPFSFLTLMDRTESAGRLYGFKHEGAWHHFSTPADVAAVNNLLATQKKTVPEEPHNKRGPSI